MEVTVNETNILRLPAVLDRVGIGKTALYAAVRRGDFPRPVRLSKRAVGWRVADVEQWFDSRPQAGGERHAA